MSGESGMRAGVAVMALLSVLASACSGRAADPPVSEAPVAADDDGDLDRSRNFYADITVDVSGAAAFHWQGEDIIVHSRIGKHGAPVNLLSAGVRFPTPTDAGRRDRFRWAFDYVGGYRDEPGTYQFTGDPVNAQGLASNAFLIFLRAKDPTAEAVYDMDEVEFLKEFRETRKPCTLEVGELERTGTLDCPELATADGETVSLRASWRETRPAPDELEE